MAFWRRRGAETVNESLLNRLGSELEHKSSTTKGTGLSFIHPNDARDILRREHIRDLFSALPWYEEDHRTTLWKDMSLILCILISMRWTEWDAFQRYFFAAGHGLKYPKYTDSKLPIQPEDFPETIPDDFLRRFNDHQYRFVPVFIRESSHMYLSTEFRLPILKIERLTDVDSAQGVVEKVLFEKRYLRYENGASNESPQVMACKRITAKTEAGKLNFKTEQRTLQSFKTCLMHNANIMQSFASFVHGSNFTILSPWANGRDLHFFLTKPDEIDGYILKSIGFSPDNLLTEAYNLASGLNFLHNGLVSTRGKGLRCAHSDLKPENVLVVFPPDSHAKDAPVGRWKIADFGLSNVEEVVTEGKVIPVGEDDQKASTAPGNIARELSFQAPTRGAGPFQPPEVQKSEPVKVSTRRDVWSYGCILAMVLAFALRGPEEVKEQTRRRGISGTDDFFYCRTNRRSRIQGQSPDMMAYTIGAEIKSPIRQWLETAHSLARDQHEYWIRHTSQLIFLLLDVDVASRPEINTAVENLKNILAFTRTLAKDRLWGFEDSGRMPEPIVIPPPDPEPHRIGNGAPFAVIMDHSPPSSGSNTARSPRSPRRDSKRSSGGSPSIFSQDDPTRSFARLTAPHNCQGATIEASGQAAALWSTREVKIYNLFPLHDDTSMWASRPVNTHTELDGLPMVPISLPNRSECKNVQLAGRWAVTLEQAPPSSFRVCTYSKQDAPQSAEYQHEFSYTLNEEPKHMELSYLGTLALQFRDRIELRTRSGSASIPLQKEFAGMSFTRTGEYFCLWERDRSEKGKTTPAYNYWNVWSQGTSNATEFKILGDTMSLPIPPYVPVRSSGMTFLAPFSTYPRFIACDRQQHVYSVRADLQNGRAHHIGKVDNAAAGFVLPDDESFMLIRGSQGERHWAERCFLTFTPDPSLQKRQCGELYRNIDVETDGAAVVPDDLSGPPYLLTLKPSGVLGRKAL